MKSDALKNIYKDCSELPIYNFFKVIDDQDYRFLFKEDVDKIVLSESNSEELYDYFKKILSEYNELTNNTKLVKEYQAKLHIDLLEYRYNISNKCISMYIEFGNFELILLLKDLGWQINSADNVYPQIVRIRKGLIGLKNKIKIAKANFVSKFNPPTSKTTKTDLDAICVNMEVGIPLSYKIDIYKDSIKRFIHYSNILYKKSLNG